MKVFIFVACLLTVTFAHDPEKVKAFYKSYKECASEIGIPSTQIDARVFKCIGEKENMTDEQGMIKKDVLLAYTEKIFITGSEEKGKEILLKCLDEVQQQPGDREKKSIAFVECTLKQNIMDLFAKPEE